MCAPGQPTAMPASAAEALTVLEGALDYLNNTNAGSLPAAEQASCLKALERAESKHTAARAAVLAAFTAPRSRTTASIRPGRGSPGRRALPPAPRPAQSAG